MKKKQLNRFRDKAWKTIGQIPLNHMSRVENTANN